MITPTLPSPIKGEDGEDEVTTSTSPPLAEGDRGEGVPCDLFVRGTKGALTPGSPHGYEVDVWGESSPSLVEGD